MKCAGGPELGPPSPREPTLAGEFAERNERGRKKEFRVACGRAMFSPTVLAPLLKAVFFSPFPFFGQFKKLTRAWLPALLSSLPALSACDGLKSLWALTTLSGAWRHSGRCSF